MKWKQQIFLLGPHMGEKIKIKIKNQVTAKVLHNMHSENLLREHFISTSQYNDIRAFKYAI